MEDLQKLRDPKFKDSFMDEWPIDRRGPTMDRAFAIKVVDFLPDESNFFGRHNPSGTRSCVFDPGVVFRVESAPDFADVVICFPCDQLTVKTTRGKLRIPSADFDPGRARLPALARAAMPDDPDSRSLP